MKFILEERFILCEQDDDDVEAFAETAVDDTDVEATPAKPQAQTKNQADEPDNGQEEPQEQEQKKPATTNTNWEVRYSECKSHEDFKNFWYGEDGYFAVEWKEKAELMKKKGAAFMQSLPEYGWTEQENVFVAFFKRLAAGPINQVGLRTIEASDMEVLKQALESHSSLPEEDFSAQKGKLKEYSLLFNPNFYGLSTSAQIDMLAQQARMSDTNNIAKLQGQHPGRVFANIYSVTGNLKDLNSAVVAGGKLRDVKAIQKALNKLFGNTTRGSASQSSIEKLVKPMAPADCKKAFSCAYNYFLIELPNFLTKGDAETVTAISRIERVKLTDEDIVSINKTLKLANTTYTESTALQLLVELAKKFKPNDISATDNEAST